MLKWYVYDGGKSHVKVVLYGGGKTHVKVDCKKISYNEWQCVDRVDGYNNLVAENLCEKCKQGEVCVDTGIRCVTEPCPSFKCVKAENMQCWLPCDRLHECRFVTPGCTYHPDIPCQEVPVPKCQSIMVSK
ncbi:hypothetical protein Btru_030018 [Bulinus truncatus]|nr:hypothetical protein Btru_030018 [Bulinus truncatus]